MAVILYEVIISPTHFQRHTPVCLDLFQPQMILLVRVGDKDKAIIITKHYYFSRLGMAIEGLLLVVLEVSMRH